MNRKEALKILHDMQKWRRRNGRNRFSDPMPHTSKAFGQAIDFAINYLRKIKYNGTEISA